MAAAQDTAYQKAHISDSRQPGIIISTSIMLAVGIIAVAARFLARRVVHLSCGADDWSILFALISFIGWCTGHLLLTRFGYGRHTILVTDPVAFGKAVLATETLYNPAIIGIKVSILCLYHRLFPSRKLLNVMYLVGAVVVAYSTTQFFAVIFQCNPIKGIWDPSVNPSCIDIGALILVMSIMNIVTDVVILILPLPIIWRLHMSNVRKLQVSGVFLMGVCVVVISIVRANYVLQTGQKDPAWLDVRGSEVTGIELGVAILTACLPAYLPLLRYTHKGRSGLTNDTNESTPMGQPSSFKTGRRGMIMFNIYPKSGSTPSKGSSTRDLKADHGRLYAGNSASRFQTEIEGQGLSADELEALENQYGMNGRILVTKSVAAESETDTVSAGRRSS